MSRTEGIKRVAIVGSGLMGHGIGQVFAHGGCQVRMQDINKTLLEKAEKRIRLNLKALAEGGLEDEAHIDEIMSRITSTIDLAEAVSDADFVTEAVPENLDLKKEIFRAMDSLAPKDAILASNTSMLRITDIGKEVKGKERLLVTHWFNPPYLIPVVEVVKGVDTSPDTVERTVSLLERMGKVPIRVLKEVPGHLVNRIQFALNRETLSLFEQGVATAEEIDKAVSGSIALRLVASGPLRTMDINGIELFYYGMGEMYRFLDNSATPQDILRQKIEKGEVGRRSGKGFFEYDATGPLTSLEVERDKNLMHLLKAVYPRD
jgi:3-hydroxybutyryl-CoA dehydrogenase